MTYAEIKRTFQELKRNSLKEDLTAHIIFTEDSFAGHYSRLERTYLVSSNNKAFWPHMRSCSIFAYCQDKTADQGVRLDWYMEEEGHSKGWKVEDCYILEQMQDAAAISNVTRTERSNGMVCYLFGNTTIQARENIENGKIKLEPVAGIQAACGKWFDLSVDRVYGYCILLERHLNERSGL